MQRDQQGMLLVLVHCYVFTLSRYLYMQGVVASQLAYLADKARSEFPPRYPGIPLPDSKVCRHTPCVVTQRPADVYRLVDYHHYRSLVGLVCCQRASSRPGRSLRQSPGDTDRTEPLRRCQRISLQANKDCPRNLTADTLSVYCRH